jgi:hypothetical protein
MEGYLTLGSSKGNYNSENQNENQLLTSLKFKIKYALNVL